MTSSTDLPCSLAMLPIVANVNRPTAKLDTPLISDMVTVSTSMLLSYRLYEANDTTRPNAMPIELRFWPTALTHTYRAVTTDRKKKTVSGWKSDVFNNVSCLAIGWIGSCYSGDPPPPVSSVWILVRGGGEKLPTNRTQTCFGVLRQQFFFDVSGMFFRRFFGRS